jgi:hypothetical protein
MLVARFEFQGTSLYIVEPGNNNNNLYNCLRMVPALIQGVGGEKLLENVDLHSGYAAFNLPSGGLPCLLRQGSLG